MLPAATEKGLQHLPALRNDKATRNPASNKNVCPCQCNTPHTPSFAPIDSLSRVKIGHTMRTQSITAKTPNQPDNSTHGHHTRQGMHAAGLKNRGLASRHGGGCRVGSSTLPAVPGTNPVVHPTYGDSRSPPTKPTLPPHHLPSHKSAKHLLGCPILAEHKDTCVSFANRAQHQVPTHITALHGGGALCRGQSQRQMACKQCTQDAL